MTPNTVVEKLRSVVGPANVVTGVELSRYVIEGRTPEAAVFPGAVEEVSTVLQLAAQESLPVVPWGGGTAMALGAPPARAGLILGLRRLDRLVEHEPGDLTATVQAGMTVAALQTTLRARGQWLSLDPPDADRATIGGVIAADASGPRRHLYGTVRDVLIGVTVVTAEGVVAHGGGKVVKNVAGYDLPKLFVGSYGTLAVVVEATVRLRPVPEAECLVAVPFAHVKDAGAAVRAIMGSDLIPNALELLDGEAGRAFGVPGHGGLLVVGFDGLREQIEWESAELGRLVAALGGPPAECVADAAWASLAVSARSAFPGLAAIMRLAVLPTAVADTIEQGTAAARARGLMAAFAAHAGVGVVTGALFTSRVPDDPEPIAAVLTDWRQVAHAGAGYATVEWAPLGVKERVPVWDDPGAAARIMQRIKVQLDPKNVLNPGRFVAGI